MDYKIIVDTSCDANKEMQEKMNISFVPFKITVDNTEFIDDENFNKEKFLNMMSGSKSPIRTSCPSPYDFLEKLEQAKENNIFILTISKHVSGSFQSANIAKDDFLSTHKDKRVCVIDSESASAGTVSVLIRLHNLINKGLSFDEIVNAMENEVIENKTFFILESLNNLIKNGRIKKTAGLIANVLNIRPIMTENRGEIILYEMNRGFKKSLSKLANALGEVASNLEERTLVISHVNAFDKAKDFEKKVKELYKFKDILILDTKGLSSGYADEGGIVIGF